MDTEKLKELLAAATPGPWEVLGDDQGHPYGLEWTIEAPHWVDEDRSGWIAGRHGGDGIATTGNPGCREDAELICAAVNALPSLLAELEAAREDAAREFIQEARELTFYWFDNEAYVKWEDLDAMRSLVGNEVSQKEQK